MTVFLCLLAVAAYYGIRADKESARLARIRNFVPRPEDVRGLPRRVDEFGDIWYEMPR